LSYIIEKAGGKSSNGDRRILDIMPQELHERSPLFIGSKHMMEELEEHLNGTTVVKPD
jgi:fructose-1,6-bisphosphatase I